MSTKHTPKTRGDSVLPFLRHVASSADMVTPLKGIANTALEIADLVLRFKTCTDEWNEFRAYIQSAITTALQSVESAGVEQPGVKARIEKLQATLKAIVQRIETRQKDSLLLRMGHFLDHPIIIAEMRKEIDDVVGLFQLGTVIRTEVKATKILQWTQKQDELANAARTLDPVLNKLQYINGASWDPYRVCLPNTRHNIINSVLSWINDTDGPSSTGIFLLTGVAGSGKSAIAHSVAQRLSEAKQLASSFFFDRDTAERNNPRSLVSTLVVDLCQSNDELARRIASAIEGDQSLIGAPITRQFQGLILNPIQGFACRHPLVIVLDALDEGYTADLLQLLCDDVPKLPTSIRIFVTSRMSPDVEGLSQKPHVHSMSLDIYNTVNMDDIALFVPYKLKQVAEKHGLGDDWPDSELVTSFLARAEGLFLWVATTCDYLKSCYYPKRELAKLVSGPQSKSSAESKMDKLYVTILQACDWDDEEFADSCRTLLGAAVTTKSPLTLRALNALFQREIMESSLALRQLSPLLTGLINDSTPQPVRFLHQSLRDFLTLRAANSNTPSAGRMFAIDEKTHGQALTLLCLQLMNRELISTMSGAGYCLRNESEISGIPEINKANISEELVYACQFWVDHILDIEPSTLPDVREQLERFLQEKLIIWMELSATYGTYAGLPRLQEWAMDKLQYFPSLRIVLYGKDVATISQHLAKRFKYMDRREEALTAARDEVTVYRNLGLNESGGFQTELARSLCSLSAYLSELGYREEALKTSIDSVALRRKLGAAEPEDIGLKAGLAESLQRLSVSYRHLGDPEASLAAIEEAVRIQCQLTRDNVISATPTAGTANYLHDLSACFITLGRHEEALEAARAATDGYRKLAATQPEEFTADLAGGLNSLSCALSGLGQHEDALETVREEVEIERRLARERPATFTPGLASSLHILSYCLAQLGRYEEALEISQEVVSLRRQLAKQRPAVFTSTFADSLHNLSCDLSNQGYHNEALAVIQEAVSLFRQLAAERPAAFNPDLALGLYQLAGCLYTLDLDDDAVIASKESVELFRPLAQRYPAVHSSRFRDALERLIEYLSYTGNDEEASLVRQELDGLSSTDCKK